MGEKNRADRRLAGVEMGEGLFGLGPYVLLTRFVLDVISFPSEGLTSSLAAESWCSGLRLSSIVMSRLCGPVSLP